VGGTSTERTWPSRTSRRCAVRIGSTLTLGRTDTLSQGVRRRCRACLVPGSQVMFQPSRGRRAAWLLALGFLLPGCVHKSVCEHACVMQQVQDRFGQPLAPDPEVAPCPLDPPRFLTQDQAVTFALWNN